MTSARVRSLWDMLRKFEHEEVVKCLTMLASGVLRFRTLQRTVLEQKATGARLDVPELPQGLWAARRIRSAAESLEMVGVVRGADRLIGILTQHEDSTYLNADALQSLAGVMEQVVSAFGDELDGRKLFVMTPLYAKYYDYPEPLFGVPVFDAFPEAIGDIANAGKCLALGCSTACVMHLMRVLEVGLKAVAKEFDVENKNDWGTYIREIEAELKRRETAAGKRTADEQFYADACTQFGSLKVAYRNPTMHVANDYSDDRAEEILVATRAFMKHLAARFAG